MPMERHQFFRVFFLDLVVPFSQIIFPLNSGNNEPLNRFNVTGHDELECFFRLVLG